MDLTELKAIIMIGLTNLFIHKAMGQFEMAWY